MEISNSPTRIDRQTDGWMGNETQILLIMYADSQLGLVVCSACLAVCEAQCVPLMFGAPTQHKLPALHQCP